MDIRPVLIEELPLCLPHGRAFYDSRQLGGVFDDDRFLAFWGGLYRQETGVILGAWDGDVLQGGMGLLLYHGPYDGRLQAQETFWWFPQGGLSAVRLLKAGEAWAGTKGAQTMGIAHFADSPRIGTLYRRLGFLPSDCYYKKEMRHA